MSAEGHEAKKPASSFSRNVLSMASGTVGAQVVALLVMPWLTRLYTPTDFGTFALFMGVAGLLGALACLRYEMAIVLPRSDKDAATLAILCALIILLVFVATIAMTWWLGGWLVDLLNAPNLATALPLLPLAVLISGMLLLINQVHARKNRFGLLARGKIAMTGGGSMFNLAAGIAGIGSGLILIFGHLVGGIAAIVSLMWKGAWKTEFKVADGFLMSDLARVMKRYRRFPLLDVWGTVLNAAAWQLPPLILAVFFPQSIVGYYALSIRVLQFPMAFIGAAIGQVFFRKSAELRSEDQPLAPVALGVFKRLIQASLVPAVVLAGLGGDLFTVVFGEEWKQAGIYVQILSPWLFWWFVSSPLSLVFIVLERQDLALLVHFFILLTRIGSLIVGGWYGDITLALGLFSGTGVLVYGILTFWNLHLAGARMREVIRVVVEELMRALPAAGLVWITIRMEFSSLSVFAIASVVCGVNLLLSSLGRELIGRLKSEVARMRNSRAES